MNDFNDNLLKFINNGTCSFTSLENTKKILLDNNYIELTEDKKWNLDGDKYFVVRGDASIIAFNIPSKLKEQFNIVCTHNDAPSFMIKPNPEYYNNGYTKLNVAPYGGILNYGFMDRPLGIAGRIILKKDKTFSKKIIDTKDAVAIIPSLAIHQNDKANTNLDLNTAVDLMPIISLDKDFKLNNYLKDLLKIKEEIYDYDLFLYNTEKAQYINDFIVSPRIDNLTCTYAALMAFINTFSDAINVLVIFNSEEIGSNTYEGADSNFLIDTIKKICKTLNLDLSTALSKSLIISADNTHATHPNHKEIADYTNAPILNDGILITKEVNGTTNGITSTIFKYICEENNIPYKYYTSRNDYLGGGTQAGASMKHLSINSLDIALPMLAMHSSIEVIGNKDTYNLYKALRKFYQMKKTIENNKISFK